MATPKKLVEADRLVAEGERYLKTSLFKWRSDYDSAAPCFEKAAVTFKNFKQPEKALKLYLKAAECHYKNDARFHAAKAKEEAGNVCFQMKNYDDCGKYCDQASEIYMLEGTPDTAALCLKRCGRKLEFTSPDIAVELYKKGADIYENDADEGRLRPAVEMVGAVARLEVKLQRFNDALATIHREKKIYSKVDGGDHGAAKRLVLGEVMILLHIGDSVQAEELVYRSCDDVANFDNSEEYHALNQLIESYNDNNQQEFNSILNQPLFKCMDTAYAKLSKTLQVPCKEKDGLDLL